MHPNTRTQLHFGLLATVAFGGLSAVALPQEVRAQSLQPAVDVCTGITLPRSAVTEVIGEVNQPIVDQTETTVNGLTTVTLVLDPTANVSDLNIDLTSILANAAAGDPISLQIVDTDGNVLTPSDSCNLTADGLTLNDEGGIAIGGNQITGLGADGEPASAGDIDAIAFGNNATTAPGATGAIAIGTDSSATAPNSVALGAGSIADRGPVAGYAAPGITGTSDSAGSVSVGAPGAERQITNVAPGTAPTDAANLAQVTGLVATGNADDVHYDDPTHASVTLDGAGGTTITNLAPGALSATSTDAVNGSQLFATNQQVAANTADIADLQTGVAALDDSAVQYDDPSHTLVTLDGAGGTRLTNVTPAALSATSTDAVNGSQLFATNANVAALQAQAANVPVRYVSDADGTTPSATPTNTAAMVSASGGATRLTNVAPAALTATSTDAVNGSQLYATNQQVGQNTAQIQTINNNLAGSTVAAVQYSNPATPTVSNGGVITNDVTVLGANAAQPVRVHNVATGTLPNDAANVGQLQAGLAATMAGAQAYTDDRIADLGFDLADLGSDVARLRRDSFSGTASAMAVAGIPQTIEAGQSMLGGGVGHFRGETAFAIGGSTTFSDGRGVLKAGATMDTHGKGGFSAGAGFSF